MINAAPQMRNFGFAAAFQIGGNMNQVGQMGNIAQPNKINQLQPQGFAQNSFTAGPGMGANIGADQRLAGGNSFGNACNHAKAASSTGQMPTMDTLMKKGQELFKGIQNLMKQFQTMFGAMNGGKPGAPAMGGAKPGAPAALAQQPNLPGMGALPQPQALAQNMGAAPAQIAQAQGADKGGKIGGILSKVGQLLGKIPGMEKVSEIFNKVTDAVSGKGGKGGIGGILESVMGLFGGGGAGKGGLSGILGGLLGGGKKGGIGGLLKGALGGILGGGEGGKKGGGLGGLLGGLLGGGKGGKKGGGLLGGGGGGLLKTGLGLVTKFL